MKVSISRSNIAGTAAAPSSKSYTLRALFCAALSPGESEIVRPLASDDTEAAFRVLGQVGVSLNAETACWRVKGGALHPPENELFCGDSAGTLRFMTAVCALIQGACRLTAGRSLSGRPVGPLIEALTQLGVECSSREGLAPVTVKGGGLKGGTVRIPGDVSSQFLSALLFIAPFAEEGMRILLASPLESRPYVCMTMECLSKFGIGVEYSADFAEFMVKKQDYRPARYVVEGDWSSVSYLLALGAVAGRTKVTGLNGDSLQADRKLLGFLEDMGAHVRSNGDSVEVNRSDLKAVRVDLSDCIDLLPTMAVLAAVAHGESIFSGISRARLKESNRVAAVREGLERMGVGVVEENDVLRVRGGNPRGAIIDAKKDHRVAMAFSILGVLAGDTVIEGAECVSKTYPDFWEVLRNLRGAARYV